MINDEQIALCNNLKGKGILYENLKNALIPPVKDKKEIAFIFDSCQIENDWYGYEVFTTLIPVLNKESTYSILCGDVINNNLTQGYIKNALFQNLIQIHKTEYKHNTQYYVVYLNNISDSQINDIVKAFDKKPYFTGYIDTTFHSTIKTILAYSLVNLCIKHKDIVIMSYEDDLAKDNNVNVAGYPFEQNGFKIKSIADTGYGLFLSYKIPALTR